MPGVFVTRRADAQKNLEPVAWSAAVIAIELSRPEIERELSTEADVDVAAVGKITHVTDRKRVDGENFIVIGWREQDCRALAIE